MNWNEFAQWAVIGLLFVMVQVLHLSTPITRSVADRFRR